jgi:hypothetical protein
MQEIANEPLARGWIARIDRLTAEDGESRVLPAEHQLFGLSRPPNKGDSLCTPDEKG